MFSIRQVHAYIGMLIAPSVLFFATTGLLQIYSLHEAHGNYTPPALLEELSAVHKDQHFAMDHHSGPQGGARPHDAGPASAPHAHDARSSAATMLLKAFFALVAVGLIFSTLAGIWMGWQQSLRRRTHLVLFAIGAIVPLALAALTV